MKTKQAVIVTLLSALICFLVFECTYYFFHEEVVLDETLQKISYIKKIYNDQSQSLILTSSITAPLMGNNIFKYFNTIGVGLNGAVTLDGYADILKILIENFNNIQSVYLFITPLRIGTKLTVIDKRLFKYGLRPFNSDIDIILNSDNKAISIKRLQENRYIFINNILKNGYSSYYHYKSYLNEQSINICKKNLIHLKKDIDNAAKVEPEKYFFENLGKDTAKQLHKLGKISKRYSLNIKLVIPPQREISSKNWSKIEDHFIKLCSNYGIEYINTGNYLSFPESAFKDSIHVKDEWIKNYHMSLIEIIPALSYVRVEN